jgi:hypothetical protein
MQCSVCAVESFVISRLLSAVIEHQTYVQIYKENWKEHTWKLYIPH